jgi:XTP/dITP diphosphohydrolase
VLVLVVAGQTTATFEGVVEGSIADQERGTDGFGYDSIFVPDGSAQTFAELSGDRKNLISHRAVAAGKLRAFLESCPAGK